VKYNAERADTGGFDQIEILIQIIEVIYHCAAGWPYHSFGDHGRVTFQQRAVEHAQEGLFV
jgi:hypothetical protein